MTSWTYHYRAAFTKDECEAIVDYGGQFPVQAGKVGHGGKDVEHAMRKSLVRWLPRNDLNLQFLFDRLILRALKANDACFHLELAEYPYLRFAHAQLTEYIEPPSGNEAAAGHYDWHEDNCWIAPNPDRHRHDRKISCVLQLSEPEQYEGGKLELEREPLQGDTFTQQGDLLFFPSHLRHRVTPVTKGTRHSLVLWFEGPRLK